MEGGRQRRRPEGEPGRRPEGGQRRRPDGDPRAAGGRRRADGPRDPRDREHAARSEGRRGPARGGRGSGGRGGGGGGRRRSRQEEPDDRPWIKRFLSKAWKPALVVCGLMIIGGVAAFAILYAMAPNEKELDAAAEQDFSATQIRWAPEEEGGEGEVALTTGEVQRIKVQYDDIPPEVIEGVLAAEQPTFYTDPGINIVGTLRGVVFGGTRGGGSTITQQMARNYYSDLSSEQTITRKIREIFIAIKLDQQLTSEEILETYLNTIYFGRGASGIEMAAQAYFGKSVDELDAAEGAFLGVIIQQPSNFETVQEGDGSYASTYLYGERWEYVQNHLVEMHEADPDHGLPPERANALEVPERIPYAPEGAEEEAVEGDEETDTTKLGYVRQAVMNEISQRYTQAEISDQDIATQGYQVQTSLDPALMDAAEDAFDVLPAANGDDLMEGLTAIRPDTGEIVAFHGGDDVVTDLDNSLLHRTQAGSSYKPYVLATALEQGIGLRTQLDGSSPQEFPGLASPVNNSDMADHTPVDLIESTADSVNTSYVDLATRVANLQDIDDTAVAMGVDPEQVTTSERGPLIALGTHSVSTLDQASGYATFANEGRHIPSHMIIELRTADGRVVPPDDKTLIESGGEQAIPADVAADATFAMRAVVEGGGGRDAALDDGRPVAGKTGTSSGAVSAWFVGYTPQLSTAVGLSRFSNEGLEFEGRQNNAVYGGTTSALVWKEFMETATEGMEVQDFPPPAYVGEDKNFAPSPSPSPTPSDTPEPTPTESPTDEPTGECPPGNGNGNDNGQGNADCPETPEETVDPCDPWTLGCEDEPPGPGEGDPGDGETCEPTLWDECDEEETPPVENQGSQNSQRTTLGRNED
ncbi:membrane peptidoglycan carboxypeptidase [Nocardiopsis sp. Huas11]|nr:membrane peptidoglycan carboxypeptidase [Nocardiopsis sp. Huas11]